MGAGWTGGGVRSRAMLDRRLGRAGARRLAGVSSLAAAVDSLRGGPYGHDLHGRAGSDVELAQHAVAATLLWHLRVLAGWQPRPGAVLLRVLAGWFEIVNTVEHTRALLGLAGADPFRLGGLATAPGVAATTSPEELRDALARSPWRDPGGTSPSTVSLGMQLSWADRVARTSPSAAQWAAAGAALVLAHARFGQRNNEAGPVATAARLLGTPAAEATSWTAFTSALPPRAGWVLSGIDRPDDLWRAERRWWEYVEQDARRMARGSGFDSRHLVGCVALLAADARQVTAALALAQRGGTETEAFDALV